MGQKIKVFVCEDIEPILFKYRSIIDSCPDLELTGTALTASEGVQKILELKPDVVLMDIELESPKSGIDATREITAHLPAVKIVILTVHRDSELIFEAFTAGAVDYILKNASVKEICTHIVDAYEGRSTFLPEISQKTRDELVSMRKKRKDYIDSMTRLFHLSMNELEIVELYMHGMSRAEINNIRSVNMSTTKTQIRSILTKMDYSSMRELTQDLISLRLDQFIRKVLASTDK